MGIVKIAGFNIEWMNDWFYPDRTEPARFRPTFKEWVINNTEETASRAAAVIREVNPDILAIQEGPSWHGERKIYKHSFRKRGGGEKEWNSNSKNLEK